MTYKTHLAVGYASVMLFTRPDTLSELILCLGTATIGAVISDVDATSSESRKNLGKVTAIAVLGTAAVFAGDYFTGLDIISRFRSSAAVMKLLSGLAVFLAVCIFGEHQPHRSFMHSLAGTAAVTLSYSAFIPGAAKYMAVSMLSHIAIDTLNRKKVQLFYPLHKPRIGFNLCYADGKVNSILFLTAGAADILLLALTLSGIIVNA